jgi:anaerobic ribonucleoside-triphosphate reductase activating protein
MEYDVINVAGIIEESIVDGPGIRYVIFTQGCPHKCKGCHNPQTHDINSGTYVKIDKIIEDINKNPLLKGITISGGEPFLQASQISKLISKIDRNKLDVIVYTGFEYEYLKNNSNENNGFESLLEKADILIDGKFDITKKSDILPFRGSTNQRSIDCKKSIETGSTILYNFN